MHSTSRAITTVQARVALARSELQRAGIPAAEADIDARILAEFVLGWDVTQFFSRGDEPAGHGFLDRYDVLVNRRASREPLAYITGQKPFWTLTFEVSPAVLIPRPETELIVEAALERYTNLEAPLSMADVGTGCGCLAIALAHERSHATVVATDVSADALSVAKRNAARHQVADRVRFIQTDLLQTVEDTFDLIVSNPPYVPEYERATLQPEVRDHEPASALFAGAGGLSVIRRLVDQSSPRLKSGGFLMFECGFGQAEAVRLLLSSVGTFDEIAFARDLQGIPRTAMAKRR